MQKAIIYTRFSTLEQRDGVSLERQLERCNELAQELGVEVERIISDSGKSAFKGKHRLSGAGLAEFEKEVRAGHHVGKVLLIEKLSRLSRENPNRSNDLVRGLTTNGVTLACFDGRITFYGYADPDFLQMLKFWLDAERVHQESLDKQDFSRDKWKRRRAEMQAGKIVTSLCPAWLRPSDDRTKWEIIDEGKGPKTDRGEVVRYIFRLADEGLGSEQIANRLNAERVPVWKRFTGGEGKRVPKVWSRGFVLRIMQNLAVIGDCQPMMTDASGDSVPACDPIRGYFPRVVQPDVFERVQAMADARKGTRGRRSVVMANLVSGLCVCEHCGERMEYRQGRKAGATILRDGKETAPYKYDSGSLVCRLADKKLAEDDPAFCDNRRWIAYLGFERALLDSCLHLAMDDGAFAQHDVMAKLNVQIADLRRDAEIATKRAEALWYAYSNPPEGQQPSAMAMNIASKAEAEAAELNRRVEALEDERRKAGGEASAVEHLSRLTAIREKLYSDDLDERVSARSMVATNLRATIEKIICHSDGTSTVLFKHGLRMVKLIPGAGRRPASFTEIDLVKEGRDYGGSVQVDRFMQRREEAKQRA